MPPLYLWSVEGSNLSAAWAAPASVPSLPGSTHTDKYTMLLLCWNPAADPRIIEQCERMSSGRSWAPCFALKQNNNQSFDYFSVLCFVLPRFCNVHTQHLLALHSHSQCTCSTNNTHRGCETHSIPLTKQCRMLGQRPPSAWLWTSCSLAVFL